jgi:uncharacterized protein (TIGR02217 family)
VRVAVGGIEAASSDFVVDPSSGIVTFGIGAEPGEGAPVTAGFEFDVPVRFDTDRIETSLGGFRAGQIPSVPLVEIVR